MSAYGWPQPGYGLPPVYPHYSGVNPAYPPRQPEAYPPFQPSPWQFPPNYMPRNPPGLSDSSSDDDSDSEDSQRKKGKGKGQGVAPMFLPYNLPPMPYPPYFYVPFPVPPPYYPHFPNQTWRNPASVIDSDTSDDEDDDAQTVSKKSKKNGLYWKKASLDEELPDGAIVGGRDTNGCTIYVGKAKYKGEELPVKVIPESHYAAVAYKGEEVYIERFKVLCERKRYKWVKCKNGNVPKEAIPGGVSENGETLFIGRAPHCGSITIGKVISSIGALSIPFGNKVHHYKEYEVLVRT